VPGRLEQIGDLLGGQIRHRNLRVDVLSFRTAHGWRPFALVKTRQGAIVPDCPAILLGLVPTKIEADELAAEHARAWIDKQLQ
jgi:hypothetical protein